MTEATGISHRPAGFPRLHLHAPPSGVTAITVVFAATPPAVTATGT